MKFSKLLRSLSMVTISLIIGFCLGIVIINSIIYVNAQSGEKQVKLADSINSQLKFSDMKLGQRREEFGENFDADQDWVKELSFKLENVSSKRIVFLQVNVNFPETRLTGNLMSYGVIFGQRPNSKRKQANPPMILEPGGILEVDLDKEKERLIKFVSERQPIQTIRRAELEIGFIIFEDKTAWTAGTFLRQDPNNPTLYKPIGDATQE